LAGNTRLTARLLSGMQLVIGNLFMADKYDISRFAQSTVKDGLEIIDQLDSQVHIGDEVIVLGNSLGSGVVTELKGKVTGIGPELVEVDAKFVSGNSGSPIIHSKTMKVIGIATFSEMRSLEGFGQDSKFNRIERRFGYRLDNVPRWHSVTWQKISQETAVLNSLNERTDDVWALAHDISKDGKVDEWETHLRRDNPLRSSVSQWQRELGKRNSSSAQLVSEKKRLISSAMMTLKADLGFLKPSQFTGYNQEEYHKAIEVRSLLTEYLRSLETQMQNDPYFYTR
jgi:hypothetical protein